MTLIDIALLLLAAVGGLAVYAAWRRTVQGKDDLPKIDEELNRLKGQYERNKGFLGNLFDVITLNLFNKKR